MNKEIYEKNINSIRNKFEDWAELIETELYQKDDSVVVDTESSVDGKTIFRVAVNGKVLYLNGKYNPAYAGRDWLDSVGEINEFGTVVIVGIHDGLHIRNILEAVSPKTNILIYEPSLEIFLKAIEEVDLSFLFEKDIPIGLIIDGINEKEIKPYFERMINYDTMTMLKPFISGNYEKLFPEKIGAFVKTLQKHITLIRQNWNTEVRYTSVKAKNIFHNCRYMYDGYSILSLAKMLPPDVPTIIVSAGPSLNKNIMDLKEAVGKANIIATDTAMKPLLNAGIMPNFFVVVDGLKPGKLFEHKDISKVPMVTSNVVATEPMKMHKGKKFYYYDGSPIENEIIRRAQKKDKDVMGIPALPSGGSVATSAYSLGLLMGSRTIILVGQDLAMTGNRTHADGTFQEKMDEIDVNSGQYFEIESVDGGKVLTRYDFKSYLDWFETQIREKSLVRVIDATEGGAKIHGAEIMTLKEAISKTCQKDFNVRYKVSRRKKMLGSKGQEEFLQFLEKMPGKLLEVKKKAATGIRQYEKLEKLAHKKQYNQNELDKVLKQIGKINKYMENDYMAGEVLQSLSGIEYTLRPTIYHTMDDTSAEMIDIAKHGVVMLRSMQYAIDELLLLADETVIPFAEKQRKKNLKRAGNN